MTEKRCSCCEEAKPLTEFAARKGVADGLAYICRQCQRAVSRKSYSKNKAARAAYFKNYRLKNLDAELARNRASKLQLNYGISVEEYNALFASQDGKCAICGTDQPGGRRYRLAVDHCHDTGKVRGLLCNNCNLGLGKFNDDPDLLRKALAYLAT